MAQAATAGGPESRSPSCELDYAVQGAKRRICGEISHSGSDTKNVEAAKRRCRDLKDLYYQTISETVAKRGLLLWLLSVRRSCGAEALRLPINIVRILVAFIGDARERVMTAQSVRSLDRAVQAWKAIELQLLIDRMGAEISAWWAKEGARFILPALEEGRKPCSVEIPWFDSICDVINFVSSAPSRIARNVAKEVGNVFEGPPWKFSVEEVGLLQKPHMTPLPYHGRQRGEKNLLQVTDPWSVAGWLSGYSGKLARGSFALSLKLAWP